jgi:hypothetical protein
VSSKVPRMSCLDDEKIDGQRRVTYAGVGVDRLVVQVAEAPIVGNDMTQLVVSSTPVLLSNTMLAFTSDGGCLLFLGCW